MSGFNDHRTISNIQQGISIDETTGPPTTDHGPLTYPGETVVRSPVVLSSCSPVVVWSVVL